MKKLIISTSLLFLVIIIASISGCQEKQELTTVRLNEVAHSIFYAPQYVAMEKGFFKDEGLNIELTTGFGADKSMTALLSKNADVALLGAEASIYVFNEGKEDYAVNFAQLTQRAGNFLVAREPITDFNWDMVRGKTIIGGRPGGMPQMVLEYILKEKDIVPFDDTNIIINIDFGLTAGAFTGGTGDFTTEFEPTASILEQSGDYYVVASLGVDSGYLPYTDYMALGSYIDENKDIIQKFTNAIYKGQIWVENHSAEEIAEVIKPHFPEADIELITMIVTRYKEQDTYKADPIFEKDGFELLQDVLLTSGELSKRVDYDDIVITDFAENAIKQVSK